MKSKACVSFMAALVLLLGLASAAPAMDFIIGAKGGYFLWDPFLERVGGPFENMERGEGVLYGPVISILFSSDLSLSLSGLYGHQSAHWQIEDSPSGPTEIRTGNYSWDATRADIDSALVYRIAEFFKIFAGYKYQYNNIAMSSSYTRRGAAGLISGMEVENNSIELPFHGPAVGIGFSHPLGERFFLAANLSVLYMWGELTIDPNSYYYQSGDPVRYESTSSDEKVDMQMRGVNFEPSIGASMGEGMPIFTLGVRVQWTQNRFVDPPAQMGLPSSWKNDFLYGVFVGVLYPF